MGREAAQNAGTAAGRRPLGGAALLRLLLGLLCVLLLAPATPASAALPVRAAIMMNLNTGRILYQKDADTPIAPASLTKLMTAFLVQDAVSSGKISLRSRERIPASVARVGGSTMHLRTGESVTVEELLTGMIVSSGNDAATALALKVGGSQAAFVRAMNEKARSVGMRSTVFKNPTGLPAAGQRTTARDMMRLSVAYLSRHPGAIRFHSVRSFQHGRRTLGTTNPFLGSRGVDGLKTGFTAASGYNIILTTTRSKTRLLIVVLGGKTKSRREAAAAELLEAGLRNPNNPKLIGELIDGRNARRISRARRPAEDAGYIREPAPAERRPSGMKRKSARAQAPAAAAQAAAPKAGTGKGKAAAKRGSAAKNPSGKAKAAPAAAQGKASQKASRQKASPKSGSSTAKSQSAKSSKSGSPTARSPSAKSSKSASSKAKSQSSKSPAAKSSAAQAKKAAQ